METLLPEIIAVASLQLLTIVSPGPDFAMITRVSLSYSKRTGVYTALGISLGILLHAAYSLAGIGLVISKSIVAFSILKYLGAAYLIYVGYKSLRSHAADTQTGTDLPNDLTSMQAIRTGFLSNALNPKVTLLFLALFTQVINESTPLYVKAYYGVQMAALTFAWYAIVSMIMTNARVKAKLSTVQRYLEKATGLVLIALGIKVAFSSK
jgi:RhtB (resistance to homoserine/threonine) family protein